MDPKRLEELTEKVARQMCVLAGLDPDASVYVPLSDLKTHKGTMCGVVLYFPGRELLAHKNSNPMDLSFERVMVPPYTTRNAIGPVYSVMWKTYRRAAQDAVLGYYAFRHVLMTEEVT